MTFDTTAKAHRLLAEGRVEQDMHAALVYRVEGDHGTYTTVVGAHVAMCSCPAQVRCSHIEAACEHANAQPHYRHLLDLALERRKQERAREADAIFDRLGA